MKLRRLQRKMAAFLAAAMFFTSGNIAAFAQEKTPSEPKKFEDLSDVTLESGRNYHFVNRSDSRISFEAGTFSGNIEYACYDTESGEPRGGDYSYRILSNEGLSSIDPGCSLDVTIDSESDYTIKCPATVSSGDLLIEEMDRPALVHRTLEAGTSYKLENETGFGTFFRNVTDIGSTDLEYVIRNSKTGAVWFNDRFGKTGHIANLENGLGSVVTNVSLTDHEIVYPYFYEQKGLTFEESESPALMHKILKAGEHYRIENRTDIGAPIFNVGSVGSKDLEYYIDVLRTGELWLGTYGRAGSVPILEGGLGAVVSNVSERDIEVIYPYHLTALGLSVEKNGEPALKHNILKKGKNYLIANDSDFTVDLRNFNWSLLEGNAMQCVRYSKDGTGFVSVGEEKTPYGLDTKQYEVISYTSDTDSDIVYPYFYESKGISFTENSEPAFAYYTFEPGKHYRIINDTKSAIRIYPEYIHDDSGMIEICRINTADETMKSHGMTVNADGISVIDAGETYEISCFLEHEYEIALPYEYFNNALTIEEMRYSAIRHYYLMPGRAFKITAAEDAKPAIIICAGGHDRYSQLYYRGDTCYDSYSSQAFVEGNMIPGTYCIVEAYDTNEEPVDVMVARADLRHGRISVTEADEEAKDTYTSVSINIVRKTVGSDGKILSVQDKPGDYRILAYKDGSGREVDYVKAKNEIKFPKHSTMVGDIIELDFSREETGAVTKSFELAEGAKIDLEVEDLQKIHITDSREGRTDAYAPLIYQVYDKDDELETEGRLVRDEESRDIYVSAGAKKVYLIRTWDDSALKSCSSYTSLPIEEGKDYLLKNITARNLASVAIDASSLSDAAIRDRSIIDENRTYMRADKTFIAVGDYTQVSLHYEFLADYVSDIEPSALEITPGAGLEYCSDSAVCDAAEDVTELSSGKVIIPIKNKSGDVRFSVKAVKPLDNMSLDAQAVVNYKGSEKKLAIGTLYLDSAKSCLISAPGAIASNRVHAYGYGDIRSSVKLYCDDEYAATVRTSGDGYWSYTFELGAGNEYSYTLTAVANEGTKDERRASVDVLRWDNEAEVTEFKLYYYNHNDRVNVVDLLNESHNISYLPSRKFTYTVKFRNDSSIKAVRIVSSKKGSEKYIDAEYDEASGRWIAKGFFDPVHPEGYVPGDVHIFYLMEDEIPAIEDFDCSSEAFISEYLTTLSEKNAVITYSRFQNSGIEYTLEFDDAKTGERAKKFYQVDFLKDGGKVIDPAAGFNSIKYECIGSITGDGYTAFWGYNRQKNKSCYIYTDDTISYGIESDCKANAAIEDWTPIIIDDREDDPAAGEELFAAGEDEGAVGKRSDYEGAENILEMFLGWTHLYYVDPKDISMTADAVSAGDGKGSFFAAGYAGRKDLSAGLMGTFVDDILGDDVFTVTTIYLSTDEGKGEKLVASKEERMIILDDKKKVVLNDDQKKKLINTLGEKRNENARERKAKYNKGNVEWSYYRSPNEPVQGEKWPGNSGGGNIEPKKKRPSGDDEEKDDSVFLGRFLEKIMEDLWVRYIVDPSGMVYEAFEDEPLSGVKATIYYENEDCEETLWDAENYEQANPVFSDECGNYGWNVPEGRWKVKFEKEGYEPAETEYMQVPPPQLGVNVELRSTEAPDVEKMFMYSDRVSVYFDKYVKAEDIADYLELTDEMGNAAAFDVKAVNVRDYGGRSVVKKLELIPSEKLIAGKDYSLKVKSGLESYNNVPVETEILRTAKVQGAKLEISVETPRLSYPENASFTLNGCLKGDGITDYSGYEVELCTECVLDAKESIVSVAKDGTFSFDIDTVVPEKSVAVVRIRNGEEERNVVIRFVNYIDETDDTVAVYNVLLRSGKKGMTEYAASVRIDYNGTDPSFADLFAGGAVNEGPWSINRKQTTLTLKKPGRKNPLFVREGYTFKGFAYYDSRGKEKAVKTLTAKTLAKILGLSKDRESDIHVRWQENTYGVKYYVSSPARRAKITGKPKAIKRQKYTAEFNLPSEITANARSGENYRVVGWAVEKNGEKVYDCGEAVHALGGKSKNGGTVKLYAVWEQVK